MSGVRHRHGLIEPAPGLPRRLFLIGVVLWPSFLTAAVATLVFFANLEPTDLNRITFPELELSRRAGYSIGFFMFWGVTALSSFMTLVLLRWPGRGGSGGSD